MTRRNIPAVLGAILGMVLALALSAVQVKAAQPGNELREEFHQTYPLAANGRVELSNLNGNVKITAWDNNEVKIDAVKTARDTERLNDCKIEVDAHPDSIRITTRYPDKSQDNPASVAYTIMVPRNARLEEVKIVNGEVMVEGLSGNVHVSSVNGTVSARALAGEVHLSTVNGQVVAVVSSGTNNLHLNSVNGRVDLTLPSDANAEVSASTVNGSISNEFGLTVDKGRYLGQSLHGKLGNGGAQVKLSTVNGSIAIRHAADGKPLSKATDLSRSHRESAI